MSDKNMIVANRIKELREVVGYTIEEFSKMMAMSKEEYEKYESGKTDIPISVLYEVSNQLDVELTTIEIERSKQYEYKNIAYKMQNKKSEVLLVVVKPEEDDSFHINTHPGQELDYVLEGSVVAKVADTELMLGAGDTLYYDSAYPHGMKAVDGPAKILVVISK